MTGEFSAYVDICVKPCHTTVSSRFTQSSRLVRPIGMP